MARTPKVRASQDRLRRRAEAMLRREPARGGRRESADLRRLVHELEVHQVELQLQNEELLKAQAALMAARDRFAGLFDQAPVAYLVLDETGIIQQANDAACALLDGPRHRLLRQALRRFVAPGNQPALIQHLDEARGTAGRGRAVRVTLDGTPGRIVRVETLREATAPSGPHEYRMTLVDLTEQVLSEQRLRAERVALERSQTALRNVTRRLMAAEENERRRIAADLHDDIAQRLHALQMELALLERRPSGSPRGRDRTGAVRKQLEEVIVDLGRLVQNLHPRIVDDLGLWVALKAYAEDLGRQTDITVHVRARAVPETVPADVATCLYRVAQEALRNVHRHATTGVATLTVARVRRGLGLCVADRGRGFDPDRVRQSGRGLGLVTMQERVSALGGHFRVRANPGDGTHVHAWVPLP
jgi:signal transduction histidine kinase